MGLDLLQDLHLFFNELGDLNDEAAYEKVKQHIRRKQEEYNSRQTQNVRFAVRDLDEMVRVEKKVRIIERLNQEE